MYDEFHKTDVALVAYEKDFADILEDSVRRFKQCNFDPKHVAAKPAVNDTLKLFKSAKRPRSGQQWQNYARDPGTPFVVSTPGLSNSDKSEQVYVRVGSVPVGLMSRYDLDAIRFARH